MSHGVTYHGGFKVGDEVEARFPDVKVRRWVPGWKIVGFEGIFKVRIGGAMNVTKGFAIEFIVSLDDIRHPHLAKEVQRGSRA